MQPLIIVVLEKCSDCVPEGTTVKLLEAALKLVPSPSLHCAMFHLLSFSFRLPCPVSVSDGGLSRDQLLVSLLSVPVNDGLLHLPLSQLPFNSVLVRLKNLGICRRTNLFTLQILLEWLCHRVDMSHLLTTPTHLSSSHQLSYDCVLDWISVLVDVHFTELTLQPQARHMLSKLHGTIFKQV